MRRKMKAGLVVALLGLVPFSAGCGDSVPSCEDLGLPSPAVLEVTLTPDSVSAGSEVTVVAAFERAVFEGGEFVVFDEGVVVSDAATGRSIGRFSNSRDRENRGEPPFVSGVVISGEVIDDRSIELTLEFPEPLSEGAVVRMSATDGGSECSTLVSGEASLMVTSSP
jgi:hypothetical protein